MTAQTGYDAFGKATNAAFPTRYQFTGREFDSFTGLQFSRARFYDPRLGRFISENPIGFAGGDVNLYGYVWNDPIQLVDPLGQNGWRSWLARFNESRWRTEQAILEALETPIYFAVGFGDTASMGATSYFRQWQGIDNVNWNCSVAYQSGGWTGLGVTAATGGVGIYRGGVALSTRAAGTRVCWSGRRDFAGKAAANHARSVGGSTLEMTHGGKFLTKAERFLPDRISGALWRDLSAGFARGASGTVEVFHNGMGIGVKSVWATTEYGILVRNNVNIVYHVIFPTEYDYTR